MHVITATVLLVDKVVTAKDGQSAQATLDPSFTLDSAYSNDDSIQFSEGIGAPSISAVPPPGLGTYVRDGAFGPRCDRVRRKPEEG